MPDFFDRLVARASGGPPPVPRVRPRLPHVFERSQPVELEQHDLVEMPSVTAPAPESERMPSTVIQSAPVRIPDAPVTRWRRESRVVDRRDTVRSVEVVEAVHRLVERIEVPRGPLLMAPVAPAPLPPERPASRDASPAVFHQQSLVDTKMPPLPKEDNAPSERRPAERRIQPPRAERVVRVSIGRLEVNAAGAQPAKPPPAKPGRPGPVVSLERYLAREGDRP